MAGDEEAELLQTSLQKFAMGGSSYRQDGNLHFDQSKFQKSKRLSSRTGSLMSANSANDDNISVESDLSNDAYVNLISANWGE